MGASSQFRPLDIPKDSDGFVKSFTLSCYNCSKASEARAFFEEYGFVVISNVFTPEQCNDTISDIWNVIESLVVQPVRNDKQLWTQELWSKTGILDEGIVGWESLWTRQILFNRQTPALHTAFASVLGTENLLVSHDRYGMFRPTKEHPERATATNLHLDMNPWLYIDKEDNSEQLEVPGELNYDSDDDWITENNEPGCSKVGELHVQGLVNLADNREEDGGFWLVPGFHKYLTQWADNHRHLRRFYGHYDQFIMIDRQYIPKLYDAACHISSRAGSAILWDQRAIHGSRPNRSQSPRYAQFIKMFPADHSAMTLERAEKRRNVIIEKLQTVNINPEADLSSLGRRLFGLEV
ncbi:unnamed protein product [Rotaria magnacalcarata]|uniref:Phytanoyl-CoA dioxygenase n=1 Tax=Rotaria magnacalcarata TaxID=392030 RepID=A0A816YMB9_9BILA|nr:unnamed protein product [Rotaria magnacalcarata]CAF2134579.1 unnamed protein product [Rotaria magnacalcarata]CAF2158493.1 unnamed protein product [Rotaria magnacalcarata]CAF3947477.1 unnamed protein product [Rotaria magnacalcarata]CAF4126123.1 unnamed protein product [Rotaria magnacalcarata]